jgi:hypothetical protein
MVTRAPLIGKSEDESTTLPISEPDSVEDGEDFSPFENVNKNSTSPIKKDDFLFIRSAPFRFVGENSQARYIMKPSVPAESPQSLGPLGSKNFNRAFCDSD